ncbi:hypothetical protein Daus18300_002960 [Diaporthe australafricana]|uniref:Ankyrin repeat protein n=1 Tax=Diaporthe australafricana TaxID=127596 RepID=A0ABR3XII0_9PEZI
MPFQPSDPLPPILHDQIFAGDLAAVAASYEILSPDPDGLLMGIAARAVSSGQVAILEWTFTRGLQLPRRSVNHHLYHCASDCRSPDVWRVLFAHGYDLNAHQSEVGDALSNAVWDGDIAFAAFLLEEGGADPNSAGGYDMNECGICAFRGEHRERAPELLRLLLRHGWKPTVPRRAGSRGATAVAAAELGLLDELRVLVEEGGADIVAAEPWFTGEPDGGDPWAWGTPLYRAAYRGQEATVAYLLDRGADPTFKDDKGRSSLWAARHGENDKVVQMFMDRGIVSEGEGVE